jgi:hypothetical protein
MVAVAVVVLAETLEVKVVTADLVTTEVLADFLEVMKYHQAELVQ